MLTIIFGLSVALMASFGFILWQARMLGDLSQKLEDSEPPF